MRSLLGFSGNVTVLLPYSNYQKPAVKSPKSSATATFVKTSPRISRLERASGPTCDNFYGLRYLAVVGRIGYPLGGFQTLGMNMVPTRLFFTKGVGKHKERLTSFEMALRDAGIAAQNLVRVSSIFPPHCKLIPRKEGLKYLNPGEVVFAVVAENSTREAHRLVVSSIGVAIPTDKSTYGYLSEHHSFGETEDQAGDYAEELAAEMLATTLDVGFDPDKSWDEKKEIYRISNKIVRTANVTQSAVGDKNGRWTTTIAGAILLFDDK